MRLDEKQDRAETEFKIDQQTFIAECDALRDQLIDLMIQAADQLYQPHIVDATLILTPQIKPYYIRSRNFFANSLNPNSARYRHNIQGYIQHLYEQYADDKLLNKEQVYQELLTIPKEIMGRYYKHTHYFGLISTASRDDFFNFEPLLRLIFQLEFIKLLAKNRQLSIEEMDKVNHINLDINEFATLVRANDSRLNQFLAVNLLINPGPHHDGYDGWLDDQLLPEDSHDEDIPYSTHRNTRSDEWCGLNFIYPGITIQPGNNTFSFYWRNGFLVFLLGPEAMRVLRKKIHWIEDAFFLANFITKQINNEKTFSLQKIAIFSEIISDSVDFIFKDMLILILFGLITIPIRLLFFIFGDLFEFPLVIIQILIGSFVAIAMGLVLYVPSLLLSIIAFCITMIVYPVVMALSSFILKPIFDFLTQPFLNWFGSSQKRLTIDLFQKTISANYQKIWLLNNRILQEINPQHLYSAQIKEMLNKQLSFQFFFGEQQEYQPDGIYFIIGKNSQIQQQINFLQEHKNLTHIRFDWQLHHQPINNDLERIAHYLQERKEPLSSLYFDAEQIDEQTMKIIIQALVGNQQIRPRAITFKINNCNDAILGMLIGLAALKRSIENIILPPLSPELQNNFEVLSGLLERNRETNRIQRFSAASTPEVEEKKATRSTSSFTAPLASSASLSTSSQIILAAPRRVAKQDSLVQVEGLGSDSYSL